jgi:hypothetical protein
MSCRSTDTHRRRADATLAMAGRHGAACRLAQSFFLRPGWIEPAFYSQKQEEVQAETIQFQARILRHIAHSVVVCHEIRTNKEEDCKSIFEMIRYILLKKIYCFIEKRKDYLKNIYF